MNELRLGEWFRMFVVLSLVLTGVLAAVAGARAGVAAGLICAACWLAYLFSAMPVLLQRHYDVFEPATLFVLSVLIGTALRAPFALLTSDGDARRHLLLGFPGDVLVNGASLMLLAMPFFALGYMQRPRALRVARWHLMQVNAWDANRVRLLVLGCLVVAGLSVFFFISEIRQNLVIQALGDLSSKRFGAVEGGEYKTAFAYNRWGASLVGLAFLFYVVHCVGGRRPLTRGNRMMLWGLGTLSVLFPAFTSSRYEMLVQLLMCAPAYVYLAGQFSRRLLVTLGAIVFALFMLVTGLRREVATSAELGDFVTRLPLVHETVGARGFVDVAKTSLQMETYPAQRDFFLGTSYLSLLVAPIPRTAWPDKPAIGLGKEIGRHVYGMEDAGVPSGLIGELWVNFGWIMIAPGTFLLGWGMRYYYESFRPLLRTRNGAVLYSSILIPVAMRIPSGDLSVGLVDIATSALPAILGIWFVSRAAPTRPVMEQRAP